MSQKANPDTYTPNIFPHLLLRIGGIAYDSLSEMQSDILQVTNSRLRIIADKRIEHKITFSKKLFHYISQRSEHQLQNQLQNLRRNIYNDRPLKDKQLRFAFTTLPSILQEELNLYLSLLLEEKKLKEKAENVYLSELKRVRVLLQALAKNEVLQNGLVLSSQNFLKTLPFFCYKPVEQFAKKEINIERSLLKYLTRIQVKTSPFSTFNNLCLGQVIPNCPDLVKLSSSKEKLSVQGHTQLNNYLFKYLKQLFYSSRQIYQRLPLRVNPTLERHSDYLVYLTNHHNVEAFQRLSYYPVVAHILEIIRDAPTGIHFHQLHARLLIKTDTSFENLERYIKRIIDCGLLEYDLGVSGTDPNWDQKLIPLLQTLANDNVIYIDKLIGTLRHLRLLANHFSESDMSARQSILVEGFNAFRDLCWKIHEAAGLPSEERQFLPKKVGDQTSKYTKKKGSYNQNNEIIKPAEKKEDQSFQHKPITHFSFKPEQLFYEDTTLPILPSIDKASLTAWVTKLHSFLSEIQIFKGNEEERIKMRCYFQEHYAKETDVRLLTFYEDYYRDLKKPEAERESIVKEEYLSNRHRIPPNPSEETLDIQRRRTIMTLWLERLKQKIIPILCTEEVNLEIELFQQINRELDIEITDNRSHSYGSFVQFYSETNEQGDDMLMGIVNSTFPGYGKMLSRFLHIFDESVTKDIRDWNEEMASDDVLFIEDCDASYFNANIHPPLMPYEIRTPGCHNSLPIHRQLPVTDFVVRYLTGSKELVLIHLPSGKRAYPFDLGFQGHIGRSELFRLLEKFTYADYRPYSAIVNSINELVHAQSANENSQSLEAISSSVTIEPRIVLAQQIVLQRKSWLVPLDHLPIHKPRSSDAEYFFYIQDWREQWGIPTNVFVQVSLRKANAIRPGLNYDDYKPQFIDFSNPLLLQLFEKLIRKKPCVMKIVEMLPESSQMLTLKESRFVTEWVVQWYTTSPTSHKN